MKATLIPCSFLDSLALALDDTRSTTCVTKIGEARSPSSPRLQCANAYARITAPFFQLSDIGSARYGGDLAGAITQIGNNESGHELRTARIDSRDAVDSLARAGARFVISKSAGRP